MSIKPLNLKQMECIHDIKNGSVCVWTRIYILTCVQVCLEGQISRKSAIKSISDGRQPAGDQIPWKICEEFQDTVFPSLSGARIVRIATHPAVMRVIIVKNFDKRFKRVFYPFVMYPFSNCSMDTVLLQSNNWQGMFVSTKDLSFFKFRFWILLFYLSGSYILMSDM